MLALAVQEAWSINSMDAAKHFTAEIGDIERYSRCMWQVAGVVLRAEEKLQL